MLLIFLTIDKETSSLPFLYTYHSTLVDLSHECQMINLNLVVWFNDGDFYFYFLTLNNKLIVKYLLLQMI
jgi:hypothetical protein